MDLKPQYSVPGALVSAAVIAVAYLAVGGPKHVWILVGIASALVLVSYVVAALTADTGFGEFMRGWLVGLNAALNVVFSLIIGSAIGGTALGVIMAVVVGGVNLLCTVGPLSQNSIYQGIVGYLNWLMPMSWLVVAFGALLYVLSFLLYGVTAGKVEFLKVTDFSMDWPTGTVFIKGGLAANLNMLKTAFNMGNFSFVHKDSGAWHKEHEAGHTLNLAAFGSVFHFIGAADENILRRGGNAYAERLAESNSTSGGGTIPMWA